MEETENSEAVASSQVVVVDSNLRNSNGPRRASMANWMRNRMIYYGMLFKDMEENAGKKLKVVNPDLIKIANQLPGRMGKQCRERWCNHLNPEINKAPWTDEEEKILIIAKVLPGRISTRWPVNRNRRSLGLHLDWKMPHGTLEVVLVSVDGLENSDVFSGTDPYAVITCQNQEKKSKVASVEGSTPTWNETFMFAISEDVTELKIKLMDQDTFTADDFVGEVTIPLEPAFEAERVPVTMYNVVKDETYCGGVNVSLKFTHQKTRDRGFSGEEFGGWAASSMD